MQRLALPLAAPPAQHEHADRSHQVCHGAPRGRHHADAIIQAREHHSDPQWAVRLTGQGCAETRLPPLQWSLPFRMSPDSSPERSFTHAPPGAVVSRS